MEDFTVTERRLAQHLAELRLARNRSLETLGELTGISRASLSRIERGESSPTALFLNRLGIAYGLTISRLLSDVEQPGTQHLHLAAQRVWQDREKDFLRRSVSPPASHFQDELVEGQLEGGTDRIRCTVRRRN